MCVSSGGAGGAGRPLEATGLEGHQPAPPHLQEHGLELGVLQGSHSMFHSKLPQIKNILFYL